jgi:glycosyltransferase involved in cell wall biosynthesis
LEICNVTAPAPSLTIVVPCYNEEAVLPTTIKRLGDLLDSLESKGKISSASSVLFVDDGSRDSTWQLIESAAESNGRISGLRLSTNRGHQNALLAGLHHVTGDVSISVDADLQDDLGAIPRMIESYQGGADIVFGVRRARAADTWFKRFTAEAYYRLLQRLGVELVFNHADFRLLSRRALNALAKYDEVNLFLRGIVPQLGFKKSIVEYDRAERFAGETKYPLRKMLALALDGLTSFSALPLRFIALLGMAVFVGSLIISIWALWVRLFLDDAVPGWTSSVLPMYLLGGIQLFSVGVLGEYVGKIYLETKRRPRYIVEQKIEAFTDKIRTSVEDAEAHPLPRVVREL